MEQWLIAALALVVLIVVITAYEIWRAERESRKAAPIEIPVVQDNVEKRARRAF